MAVSPWRTREAEEIWLLPHADSSGYLHFLSSVWKKLYYVSGAILSAFPTRTRLIFPTNLREGQSDLQFTEEETEAEVNNLNPGDSFHPVLTQWLSFRFSNKTYSFLLQDLCTSYAFCHDDLPSLLHWDVPTQLSDFSLTRELWLNIHNLISQMRSISLFL